MIEAGIGLDACHLQMITCLVNQARPTAGVAPPGVADNIASASVGSWSSAAPEPLQPHRTHHSVVDLQTWVLAWLVMPAGVSVSRSGVDPL